LGTTTNIVDIPLKACAKYEHAHENDHPIDLTKGPYQQQAKQDAPNADQ
jgi:hypothetical protein